MLNVGSSIPPAATLPSCFVIRNSSFPPFRPRLSRHTPAKRDAAGFLRFILFFPSTGTPNQLASEKIHNRRIDTGEWAAKNRVGMVCSGPAAASVGMRKLSLAALLPFCQSQFKTAKKRPSARCNLQRKDHIPCPICHWALRTCSTWRLPVSQQRQLLINLMNNAILGLLGVLPCKWRAGSVRSVEIT